MSMNFKIKKRPPEKARFGISSAPSPGVPFLLWLGHQCMGKAEQLVSGCSEKSLPFLALPWWVLGQESNMRKDIEKLSS